MQTSGSVFLFLCLLLCWFPALFGQISVSELANSADEPAEEIANKTYAQEQSDLQRAILRGYDRKIRPVLNQSRAITILFHAYLIALSFRLRHFSVDQLQQTIFLNGHIYMTWSDEQAVWDPVAYNNVRTTMVKQWEVWQPELRIANSVSGVNQYFEISRRSHATLTSLGPNKTKVMGWLTYELIACQVEFYPTFSMRIGCNFDYSDYPYDEQTCAARLYTPNVMSEVELAIYYNLDPSVMLGWGNHSSKRHVQDWELMEVEANMSYYKTQSRSTDQRPMSSYEAQSTWTLILLGVRLRRNAPQFWLGLGLPCLASELLILLSFLPARLEHSVALLLANFFLQAVILRDVLRTLPPAAGTKPRIVTFCQLLLGGTLLALLLNLFSRQIAQRLAQLPAVRKLLLIPPQSTEDQQQCPEPVNSQKKQRHPAGRRIGQVQPLLLFRICCLLLFLLFGIPATFFLLLF